MANETMTLISTVTVGAGGASTIDFTSIPQTYTDLKLYVSTRTTSSGAVGEVAYITLNGSTSSFTGRYLQGSGSATSSGSLGRFAALSTDGSATANTFSNNEIYIANYAGSTYKAFSGDAVVENNATTSYQELLANLWSNTAAITSITLNTSGGVFAQYSTVSLYGILKGSGGATVS